MPGLPATRRTACRHLCDAGSRRGSQPATSDSSIAHISRGDGQSDVGDRQLTHDLGPVAEVVPGLGRRERHRSVGAQDRLRSDAGVGVDPASEHRLPARVRRRPRALATSREIRCRTRRRSRDRQAATWRAGRVRRSTRTAAPRSCRRSAATRPSAPLLPGPARTVTRRPYVPPSISSATRATALPARSTRTSTGSAAAASIARISSRVTIGITAPPSLGDDVGDGDEIGVSEAEVPVLHAGLAGEGERLARRTRVTVTPSRRARPTPRGTRTRRARDRATSSRPHAPRIAPPATAPGRPWERRTRARSA